MDKPSFVPYINRPLSSSSLSTAFSSSLVAARPSITVTLDLTLRHSSTTLKRKARRNAHQTRTLRNGCSRSVAVSYGGRGPDFPQVIGAAPGAVANRDYVEAWRNSDELREVKRELRMKREHAKPSQDTDDKLAKRPFAASMWTQYLVCTYRVFQQYWRTPTYIYSKTALSVLTVRRAFFRLRNSRLTFAIRLSSLASPSIKQTIHSRAYKTRCSAYSCVSRFILPCFPCSDYLCSPHHLR